MDKAQKYARRINVEEFNSCNEYELARAYEAGYHEAEKDLALTWEDVKKICSLSCVVEVALGRKVSDETHYAEVLRRFNEYKQKTK